MNFTTNPAVQDIAMNLIMNGYSDGESAIKKAEAIYAGMEVINNLNEASTEEYNKTEVYRSVLKTEGFHVIRENVDTSTDRANILLGLKNVEWKMMMDVTGLNEFQIMEVA